MNSRISHPGHGASRRNRSESTGPSSFVPGQRTRDMEPLTQVQGRTYGQRIIRLILFDTQRICRALRVLIRHCDFTLILNREAKSDAYGGVQGRRARYVRGTMSFTKGIETVSMRLLDNDP